MRARPRRVESWPAARDGPAPNGEYTDSRPGQRRPPRGRRLLGRRCVPAYHQAVGRGPSTPGGTVPMTKVLVSVALDGPSAERLRSLPGVTVHTLAPRSKEWDVPPELVRGTEVLLCKVPPRNLFDMTDLKMMQLSSVGYEHLRHLGLADRPLRVCNARGVFDTAIAEWNLTMMVALARDLRGMLRNQERRHWDRAARFQQEVRGGVVGLWGYGGIGRETARLAKAFGMTVHVLTRSGVGPRRHAYAQPGTGDP